MSGFDRCCRSAGKCGEATARAAVAANLRPLTDQDVLADFENNAGDPVCDIALPRAACAASG